MPKDNNIRSFRITPESERILERLKQEKKISNTSEFINQLICAYIKPQPTPRDVSDVLVSMRTIPEKAVSAYLSGGSIEENIRLNSIPFCHMNIKRHSEAKKIIEQNGMGYFYFPVNDDMSMAIIACNREEASIQFQQYYLYNNESRQYVRTSAPLPQYRFDPNNKNIIIIEANNQPLR